MINPINLQTKIEEFLDTQDNTEKDEWYTTERGVHKMCLENFFKWLFSESITKAERRKLYEELKKEFDEN